MTPEKLAVARQLYDAKQDTIAEIAQLLAVTSTATSAAFLTLGEAVGEGVSRPELCRSE